jgi:hypothetical protein
MAQADEDDFFGIKQLESKPLPEFYHRSNATTLLAQANNVKSKQPKLDPFEENFFPELAERYEQENVEEDMTADQAEEVGFFEEHFARFDFASIANSAMLKKIYLEKAIRN